MRKTAIFFNILLIAVFGLTGCTHKIAGNYPHYSYIDLWETKDGFLVYGYEISLTDKTYTESTAELSVSNDYLDGGTAPLYLIHAPQGYEGVEPHIKAMRLENKSSVVDARGYIESGTLYGFVNVYKDTIGYLSGGGNYGVEEISRGIIFSYEPDTDVFTVMERMDGCNIVAFYNGTVLYWKNRKYYSYDLVGKQANFLTEDKSYDTGLQHQSYTYIYTNRKYTAFIMVKAQWAAETTFTYVYCYENGGFYALEKAS